MAQEEKKEPKITRIYWINEQGEESDDMSEIEEGEEVTLMIDVEDAEINEVVYIDITPPGEEPFWPSSSGIRLVAWVEQGAKGLVAKVENFSFEFKSSWYNDFKVLGL